MGAIKTSRIETSRNLRTVLVSLKDSGKITLSSTDLQARSVHYANYLIPYLTFTGIINADGTKIKDFDLDDTIKSFRKYSLRRLDMMRGCRRRDKHQEKSTAPAPAEEPKVDAVQEMLKIMEEPEEGILLRDATPQQLADRLRSMGYELIAERKKVIIEQL